MNFPRYLDLLRTDAERLATVASRGLAVPVRSCPGWTVEDVVRHVSEVYLHKVECIRRQQSPEPWPPDLSHRLPIELFQESLAELVGELETRGPTAPSYTWHRPDQTVGFWYRRMAQETAVHRVDVELAHDVATPVDQALAVDGIDEVLAIMLAGDWSDEPVDEAAGRAVLVQTDGQSWRIGLDRTEITFGSGDTGHVDATVAGPPSDLLLWLWGRAPLDRLSASGDATVIKALRERLIRATQ